MSDLIDDPDPGENAPEFTVSEISGAIKRVIEGEFGHVRVRGEIGRVSRPRSGHVYLDLKDDRSVLSGVIWKGVAARLPTQPEEGLEVVARGKLTTFGGQSKYQIVIEDIRPAGVGALMAMLEKCKKTLAAEGLFAPERKKPLPYLPEIIGVITSPSGAVIRDILHRLRDRFPRRVLIWPVAVQGDKCAPEVARAIAGFNALKQGGAVPRPDLLIVARGGGSIEDLWGFNEEIVVRAAAASDIPLISAVGHETDTTLIDHAADYRAPTPTAAAERAVPVRLELLAGVGQQGARLSRALSQSVTQRRQRLRDLSRALPRPDTLTANARQRLDMADQRLPGALRAATRTKRARLTEAAAILRPATLGQVLGTGRDRLALHAARLKPGLIRAIRDRRAGLDRATAGLRLTTLRRETDRKRTAFAQVIGRLGQAARAQKNAWRANLDALDRVRHTLGYEATLARGYTLVWAGDGLVSSVPAARAAGDLEIQFRDGRVAVAPRPATTPKKPARTAGKTPGQGSLF